MLRWARGTQACTEGGACSACVKGGDCHITGVCFELCSACDDNDCYSALLIDPNDSRCQPCAPCLACNMCKACESCDCDQCGPDGRGAIAVSSTAACACAVCSAVCSAVLCRGESWCSPDKLKAGAA